MDRKIGCYICTGCDIGKACDIEKLEKHATREFKVPVVKSHDFLCSHDGVQVIKDDIKNEGVNHVVIGACSSRHYQTNFDFGAENIVVRAPLREMVAWTQPHGEEDTQLAGEDYLGMYISRIKQHSVPEPQKLEVERSLLVVGGGTAGMTAAIEAASAGYKVHLVEKEAELGGTARTLHQRFPSVRPFKEIRAVGLQDQIAAVEQSDAIDIYTGSKVAAIGGQPGQFDVKLDQGGTEKEFKAGAVVMASGARPYDYSKLTHLGADLDHVVDSAEFEAMAKAGVLKRKDGKSVKSVAFVQCAGSRDEDHLPYCSSVCCMTSLKQAAYLRSIDGNSKAYIFYKDMRTPGEYESFYREQQDDPGVFLTKGNVKGVSERDDRDVVVAVSDTLLGEEIEVSVDLVVLATGLVANSADGESVLNLQYRQGPDLPDLKYGFPDSHFVCFPYETRRTGIYVAGTARQPMDLNGATTDATGAALKAIQSVELASRGERVHPRAGDLTFPEFRLSACTQCKRCTEECPFGVLDEDEKGTPKPNPSRCRGCGTCMGACPQRIISFPDYSINAISEMIKGIEMPEEDDEKPRVLAFICENDAGPVFDVLAQKRTKLSPWLRVIPVRCLGSTNLVWVADALGSGWDGIMFLGCEFGDNYQCHFTKGSELCNTRLGKVQDTISSLALESERVEQFAITMNDTERLPKIVDEFVEMLDDFGPNPFKDM